MVGPTLIDIREHIEGLATEDGQYYLRCGRTGDRPVPAAGSRFPDRATARAAAGAIEQYRSALRRYDPQVPYHDLIVCEELPRNTTEIHESEAMELAGVIDPRVADRLTTVLPVVELHGEDVSLGSIRIVEICIEGTYQNHPPRL